MEAVWKRWEPGDADVARAPEWLASLRRVADSGVPSIFAQRPGHSWAFLADFRALAESSRAEVEFNPPGRDLSGSWLLLVSDPGAVDEIDDVIACFRGGDATIKSIWLAVDDAWESDKAATSRQIDFQDSAGTMPIDDGAGHVCRCHLMPPKPHTMADQLRGINPMKQLPEGPGNLRRRADGFQDRARQDLRD